MRAGRGVVEHYDRRLRAPGQARARPAVLSGDVEQPHESIQPDKFTYTALLKSYVMVDDFAAAEQILEDGAARAAYTRSLRNANVDDVLEGSDGAVALPLPRLTSSSTTPSSRATRGASLARGQATLQQMRSRACSPTPTHIPSSCRA